MCFDPVEPTLSQHNPHVPRHMPELVGKVTQNMGTNPHQRSRRDATEARKDKSRNNVIRIAQLADMHVDPLYAVVSNY